MQPRPFVKLFYKYESQKVSRLGAYVVNGRGRGDGDGQQACAREDGGRRGGGRGQQRQGLGLFRDPPCQGAEAAVSGGPWSGGGLLSALSSTLPTQHCALERKGALKTKCPLYLIRLKPVLVSYE